MHRKLKQKLCIYAIMLVLLIAIDFIISGIVYKQVFIQYPLLEISSLMIALAPMFFFKKNRYSIVYASFIIGLLVILMVVSLLLNYASGDIFSVRYLFLFGEAAQVMSMQFVNVWYIVIAVLIITIYVLSLIIINRIFKIHIKIDDEQKQKRRYYPLGISIAVVSVLLAVVFRVISLNMIKNDNKNVELYKGMSGSKIIETSASIMKRGAMKKYGFLSFLTAELSDAINTTRFEKREMEEFFNDGEIINDTITDDFSGICKDMNVITIMIETGVDQMINETLTPNLYKLMDEGINFTNNHSKNKTNISEILGIVGSVAEVGATKNYNIKASLPNVLKSMNYSTTYFHNNSASFYSRRNVNESMGFEESYFKDEIDPNEMHDFLNGNYPLDSYFMNGLKLGTMNNLSDRLEDIDGILDKIVPAGDKKFYSFWTTMSTHGPYNTSTRNMKYYEDLGYVDRIKEAEAAGLWTNICADDNINFQNQIINFQCEFMDLDLAVGAILNRLEELGKADDTLIVLYGDHEPYYMSNGEKQLKYAIYNTNNNYDSSIYKTTLIMHNKALNQKYNELYGNTEYTKFTSPYNIVPTIVDLLGVKYNSNHYVSKSVFLTNDSTENIFYSSELEAIFTDNIYATDIKSYSFVKDGITDADKQKFDAASIELAKRIVLFNRFYAKRLYNLMK